MSQASHPQIRKAALVFGKTLIFRDATVEDAALILNLRTDEKKGRFLSATSDSLEVQQAWLRAYAVSTGQAYFIIERGGDKPSARCGFTTHAARASAGVPGSLRMASQLLWRWNRP
jgi:hypothetical protein